MLELPEVLNRASELNESVVGKKIRRVLTATKLHKFCWYNGNPEEYKR